MKYTITQNLDDPRIIPFLLNDERASIYHHPFWIRSISKTFNHKPFYLLLEDDNNELLGLVPYIKLNNILRGKEVVSVPFSTFCNLLIPEGEFDNIFSFLVDKFGKQFTIELRTLGNLHNSLPEFSHSPEYYNHTLYLSKDLETTFDGFHPRSVRGSIRRAQKNNLTVYKSSSECDLKIFYELEFNLRKRILLPTLPYSFFKNVLDLLSIAGLVNIYIVKKDSIPIAAAFVMNFKDTYYIEYAASDKKFINLYPNHKLYWEIIKDAHNNGANKVDFGRTSFDNKSLAIFKEKWGAQKKIIYFSYFPSKDLILEKHTALKKILTNINSHIPDPILKIEGKFLYHYLS